MKLTDIVYWVGSGEFGLSHYKDCHVYLIHDGEHSVLIDSGCGIDITELKHNIEQVTPLSSITDLFLTHGHGDHSGGAAALQKHASFHIHASAGEKALVESGDEWGLGLTLAKRKGAYPQDYRFPVCHVDDVVEDGAVYEFGSWSLRAVKVPGHSVDGVCYVLETPAGRALFSGDTAFLNGYVSIINCPGCELGTYRDNIGKLAGLGIDCLFPGHGSWTLKDGQKHLDAAVSHFSTSALPLMR